LEADPYESKKQRQEREVHALLDKIPASLISLDPTAITRVDKVTNKTLEEASEAWKDRGVPKHLRKAVKKGRGRSKTRRLQAKKTANVVTMEKVRLSVDSFLGDYYYLCAVFYS